MSFAVVAVFSIGVTNAAAKVSTPGGGQSWHRPVCPGQAPGKARCHSDVVTDSVGNVIINALPSGYGPAQFHGAYNLPTDAPGTPTIAIVDAYNDPTAESDLATYSSTYGLPACTTGNGCFTKVNQNGNASPLPVTDGGWAEEISLDLDVAHAICENCHLLLVEANSNSYSDLAVAVNRAATMGANVISNSYGGSEVAGDSAYNHPGIAITASTGDGGYGTEYPASSSHVIAVGGTTLNVTSLGPGVYGYGSESVWNGAGSGCSVFYAAQPWQTADPNWAMTGCGTKRGAADVSADADPATGAAVYDTTPPLSGWAVFGGTSLSAPLIASVYALTGTTGPGAAVDYPASTPYGNRTGLHDVTIGANGICGTSIMCKAVAGYDGPTGVGTPNGLASFTPSVGGGPVTVTAVKPTSVGQGGKVTEKIFGTGFVSGAAVSISGAGVTVSSVSFVSSTQVNAVIHVASGAATGKRDVTVTNTNASTGTCSNCLTINPGPVVTSVVPSTGLRGTTIPVQILGSNFVNGAKVKFGNGITVNSVTFVGSGELDVSITIASATTTGGRTVTVTNKDKGVGSLKNGFSVN